jgi:PAS domain S-box-containing protein
MTRRESMRTWLVLGLVCSNILVFAVCGYSLSRSRQQYELRAQTLSQNIASGLDHIVSSSVKEIDLALHTVVDELERELAGKGIDEKTMNAFMARQEERITQIDGFRVSNAAGQVTVGTGLNQNGPVTVSDRDYFLYHRDHTGDKLYITKPLLSRINQRYVIVFARRYNYSDGSFAGVVHVAVRDATFQKMLSQFAVRPNDALVLRDADLGLISRYPPMPSQPGGVPGDSTVSDALRQLAGSGTLSATYYARVNADGIARTITFHRLTSAAMLVLVGLASDDYLEGWRSERFVTLGLTSIFLLLSLVLGSYQLWLLTQAGQHEQALSATNESYRSILAATLDGYLELDSQGKVQDANSAYVQLSGYVRDELLAMNISDLTTLETPSDTENHIQRIIENGADQFESTHRRKDGALWNAEVSTTYCNANGGQFFVFLRDITERKKTQHRLEHLVAEQKALLENELVGIARVRERTFQWANPALEKMLGYSSLELEGMNTSKIYASEAAYQAFGGAAYPMLLNKEIFRDQHQFLRKDEGLIWLDVSASLLDPIIGESLWVFTDITAQKAAETELLRSNGELEQFSYSISHDMRQPLRMISSYLQLLEASLADKLASEQREYFDFAIDGAKRLDAMMLGLLEYSRVGRKGEPACWVESRFVLQEALQFLQPAVAEAQAEVHIEGDWPKVLVSPDEMLRLLQNLIANALKFRVAGRAPQITLTSEATPGRWRLCVSDNGIGIEPAQSARLFQVFARLQSRAAFEGNGIGLALCRKIAEHHGGRIWVESAGEGLGSRFFVEMPLPREDRAP